MAFQVQNRLNNNRIQGQQQGGCASGNCGAQANSCCQKGEQALKNGGAGGLDFKQLLQQLMQLAQKDPDAVAKALRGAPQFANAIKNGMSPQGAS